MKKGSRDRAHRAFLIVAVAAVAAAAAWAGGASEPQSQEARILESIAVNAIPTPRAVPEIELELISGEVVTLSDFAGSVVLLNVWATWCEPCKLEMPSMESLKQEFSGEDLVVLAVDHAESREQVEGFLAEYPYTFTVALDPDRELGQLLGVRGLPSSYIISRESEIIGVKVGTRFWDTPEVYDAFRLLLGDS